jgi:hypothetical protein
MIPAKSRFYKKGDEHSTKELQAQGENGDRLEKTLLFYYLKDQGELKKKNIVTSSLTPWMVFGSILFAAMAFTALDDYRMINAYTIKHVFMPYSKDENDEIDPVNNIHSPAHPLQKNSSQQLALTKPHLLRELSSLEEQKNAAAKKLIAGDKSTLKPSGESMRFIPIDISSANKIHSKMKIINGHLVIKNDSIDELTLEIKDQEDRLFEIDVESEQLQNGLFRYLIGDQPLSGTIVRSNAQEYMMSFINGDLRGIQVLFSAEEKLWEREKMIQDKELPNGAGDNVENEVEVEIERDPETQRQLSSIENEEKTDLDSLPKSNEPQFVQGLVVKDKSIDDETSFTEEGHEPSQMTALEERYQTVLSMGKNDTDQGLKEDIQEEKERTNGEFGF